MIKRGVDFTVTYKVRERSGLFKKKLTREVTETFNIQEPTLAVLDHLSAVWMGIGLNEDLLGAGGTDTLIEAKRTAAENTDKAAEIVAIAVLGEDYYINEMVGNRFKTRNDDKELERLKNIFKHSVQPSKLFQLATLVTNMSNLGDFIGSMRLMSGARTAAPKQSRIE